MLPDLFLPWTVDEVAAIWPDGAAVVVSDSEGGIACTVPFAPDEPGDEDVARFVAQVICDRVNARRRVLK